MEHIENTNQRKINQKYIDTSYKKKHTKHSLETNTIDLLKHPNTYIKKPIPHTNINKANYTQHQPKHINDLTRLHIKTKIVHTHLNTYKKTQY